MSSVGNNISSTPPRTESVQRTTASETSSKFEPLKALNCSELFDYPVLAKNRLQWSNSIERDRSPPERVTRWWLAHTYRPKFQLKVSNWNISLETLQWSSLESLLVKTFSPSSRRVQGKVMMALITDRQYDQNALKDRPDGQCGTAMQWSLEW